MTINNLVEVRYIVIYFTSDTHFGTDAYSILKREMRPFANPVEYMHNQVAIWNMQAGEKDIIYHLGDFCNYNYAEKDWKSGLQIVKEVKARIVLIIGNNERRLLVNEFKDDFERFKEYCMRLGFESVHKELDLTEAEGLRIGRKAKRVYLVHHPVDCKEDHVNLFGHTHRAGGLYRNYGLNVGTDLNHFRLFSRDDIEYLLSEKEKYWDTDESLNKYN